MAWINSLERLPEEKGIYKIKNNFPECNNGEGQVEWDGKNWIVAELMKSFFKVLYWWEK